MRKFLFISFISCVLLIGCASAPEAFLTEHNQWCLPEIGTTATCYIGDTIIKEGIEDVTDAIILKEDHGALGWTAYHPAGNYKYCGNENIKIATKKKDKEGNTIYEEINAKKFRFPNRYSNGWGGNGLSVHFQDG